MHLTKEQASDKSLIQYLAEQAIKEPVSSIKKLGGAMAWNYEVNGHLIFKLPKQNSLINDWENQEKIAPILQTQLKLKIPHPHTKQVYTSTTSQEALTSLSYEKIQGTYIHPKDFLQKPTSFKEKYFEQLSQMMIQLHSIPLELFPFEFLTKIEYIKKYLYKNLETNILSLQIF